MTVISQTLMMVGAFDPVTVVGVENGLLLLLWAWMEWAQWSTRS